ncbi:hypothetical protein ACT8ZV_18735 [Nocardioides sp. MAHUQ-72]|uniref:hypothetical protein n=1 Tax=unclassified Nocardioides TaxID=2615069 RepID=UPI00361DBA02
MSTLAKILVTLGLVLPLGAFVAGSLAASGAEDPGPRETIVIRDSPTRSASPHDDRSPSSRPSRETHHDGPEVVTPSLDDLGDDHGGDRAGDGGGHGSDDSGRDDHTSGHGRDDGEGRGDDSVSSGGSDDSGGGGHG